MSLKASVPDSSGERLSQHILGCIPYQSRIPAISGLPRVLTASSANEPDSLVLPLPSDFSSLRCWSNQKPGRGFLLLILHVALLEPLATSIPFQRLQPPGFPKHCSHLTAASLGNQIATCRLREGAMSPREPGKAPTRHWAVAMCSGILPGRPLRASG